MPSTYDHESLHILSPSRSHQNNDTAMESAINMMMIHSSTSIRLVPARSDILP